MDCPHCGSEEIIKKGKRQLKTGEEQLYFCKNCQRKFVDRPLKNKSYPAEVIIKSLQYYYGGSSLAKTADRINQEFEVGVSRSTVHNWTKDYEDLCSFSRLRDRYRSNYGSELIKEYKVRLNGNQETFKVHRAKLSRTETRQPQLADYLRQLRENEIDVTNNSGKEKNKLDWSADSVYQTEDKICRLSKFALKSVGGSYRDKKEQARSSIQDFLLACDSRTVATRVPVPSCNQQGDWSKIDLLQEKVGKIFLLSYEPEPEGSQPLSYLYRHAKALSCATDIPLSEFRAAWFDEGAYREFKPSDIS